MDCVALLPRLKSNANVKQDIDYYLESLAIRKEQKPDIKYKTRNKCDYFISVCNINLLVIPGPPQNQSKKQRSCHLTKCLSH